MKEKEASSIKNFLEIKFFLLIKWLASFDKQLKLDDLTSQ